MHFLKKILLSNGLTRHLIYQTNRLRWSLKGCKLSSGAKVGFSSILEGRNCVGNSSIVNSKLGFATYVGDHSEILNMQIGKYCSIGSHVNCILGTHPTKDFISTHPAFFSAHHSIGFTYVNENKFVEHNKPKNGISNYNIVVGNDVWIANNVAILEGITIGDGAIIAANALVTKDVMPYSIVGGVPAKEIKKRFSENEIKFLLQTKWWNKSEKELKDKAKSFENFESFKNFEKSLEK